MIGFGICYCIACLFFFLEWEYDIQCMEWFVKPWAGIAVLILVVPVSIWCMIHMLFQPVEPRKWADTEHLFTHKKHVCGNVYLIRDKNAKWPWQRLFFVRIKKME